MKEILLTKGQVAIVDEDDFNWLNQWKWSASQNDHTKRFYAVRNNKGKIERMHRKIINAPKGKVVDHINHNTLDNRKINLRICSNRQNLQNKEKETSSQYTGVTWVKHANKWRAQIRIEGEYKHIGYFKNEREAAMAYENEVRKLGEELICKLEE